MGSSNNGPCSQNSNWSTGTNFGGAGYQADANTDSANQMNIISQLQIPF